MPPGRERVGTAGLAGQPPGRRSKSAGAMLIGASSNCTGHNTAELRASGQGRSGCLGGVPSWLRSCSGSTSGSTLDCYPVPPEQRKPGSRTVRLLCGDLTGYGLGVAVFGVDDVPAVRTRLPARRLSELAGEALAVGGDPDLPVLEPDGVHPLAVPRRACWCRTGTP